MNGVVERFNPETVAGGKQGLVRLVPEYEGELAPQLLHAMRSKFLVQVQRDLTVRSRLEQMSALFQLTSLALKVIELAVDNYVELVVLVRDWLIAGRKVNDAQPRMTKTNALIGGQ